MIDLAKVGQRLRNGSNKRIGNAAELVVINRLRYHGFAMVEPIHVGFRNVGGRWVPGARVSGDIRAVGPGGRSVLCEVKVRKGTLAYSALERHQVIALGDHYLAGGLSLLAWYCPGHGLAIMPWHTLGLVAGSSLTWEQAQQTALAGHP